ncbi:flagellar biosynthetic protein FliQ [Dermatobacter hominis]|uniref:flagellar biosynthetic protein FliQ n=1 Tax=Dermatobacter hominis TaxID=2884263 RepID=UPI001D119944|nr:flagellar biosynthetic protein FliQ [Dermatobacter hominis]UDY37194.1 flagellar biosynthetic protein FliQ [Dermatobacter hominis]
MTDTAVVQIGTDAMLFALKLGGPLLLVTLGIGLAIGLVQSVTQLQEQTLTFVPKCFGVALVLLIGGAWMLQTAVSFTTDLMAQVPDLLG